MAIDPTTDANAVKTQLETALTISVHEGVATGVATTYVNGVLVEYATIGFGSPVATATGRSLGVETQQPGTVRVIAGYVSGTAEGARTGGGSVVTALTGFVPSTNAGPLRLIGGGSYTIQEAATKPIRYVQETYFLFDVNMDPPIS